MLYSCLPVQAWYLVLSNLIINFFFIFNFLEYLSYYFLKNQSVNLFLRLYKQPAIGYKFSPKWISFRPEYPVSRNIKY